MNDRAFRDHTNALISVSGCLVRLSKPARPNAIKRRIESVAPRRATSRRVCTLDRARSKFVSWNCQ